MLTRDQLLGADDRKAETVSVPEWGGDVRIAVMTGAGRDDLQKKIAANKSNSFFEATLLVATLVGEDGVALLTEADVEALQTKSSDVVARVAKDAMRLNGLGQAATDAALGNSNSSQSSDSGTA